jgi:hypothetical protein
VFRRSLLAAALLAALVVSLVPTSSGAHTLTRTDGNDTKGPLDMAAVRSTHTSKTTTFRVTTHGPFTNTQINGENGFLVIDVDIDGDRKANRSVVVFYASGKMRGVLVRPSGSVVTRSLNARRVSGKALEVTVPFNLLGKPKSFDFAAFSFYVGSPCSEKKPCVDSIPNRYPLIRHDLTAPTFRWSPTPPKHSVWASASLTLPVSFRIKDDTYGSGVGRWTLSARVRGTSTWTTVKTGTAASPTVQVSLDEGTTYDFRVTAADKQGNRVTGPLATTTAPYDDVSDVIDHQGSWSHEASDGPFLGTRSIGEQGATATLDVPGGKEVCVLGGPTSGPTATIDIEVVGIKTQSRSETGSTGIRQFVGCVGGLGSPGSMTVIITVTSAEPFVLDGVSVVR